MIVKALSSYQKPIIIADWLMRKKMRGDGVREKRQQSLVNAPYACKKVTILTRFIKLIYKGNMIEA